MPRPAPPPAEHPPGLEEVPAPLRPPVERAWARYRAAGGEAAPPGLARVFACSAFVAEACVREPDLPAAWVAEGLERPADADRYRRLAGEALAAAGDEEAAGAALRRLRRRELARIAWRDLAGLAPLEETVAELSAFAAEVLDAALAWLEARQSAELGEPLDPEGRRRRLVVLGLGKLGGGELNFSSDVDLVLAWPAGVRIRGRRPVEPQAWFTGLARRLVDLLERPTAEGRVFRVDLRLRPFGDAGPLVLSGEALEEYAQAHGRTWERYAWLKAACVAGDRAEGARILAALEPFVYRRYLDFGALEELRALKARIERQVRRRGMEEDLKLGPGGIRELEFVVQAIQLVRGGREPALRRRGLLEALAALDAAGHLPPGAAAELGAAYRFLRRAEHRLQAWEDRQTQRLPREAEGRLRLAYAMGLAGDLAGGLPGWGAFARELEAHRARVQGHFQRVLAAPQAAEAAFPLAEVWEGTEPERAAALLRGAGYRDPAAALARLEAFRRSPALRALGAGGRARLDRLLPLLLGAAGGTEAPEAALGRALEVLEGIRGRATYLALLVENPLALSQLARLCAASAWIAALLARRPLLLDELLDPRRLYAPLDREALAAELEAALAGVPGEDLEARMDLLRRFKEAQVLRVAAAELLGGLEVTEASARLTELAELLLDRSLGMARAHLEARHGWPRCPGPDGGAVPCGFLVVGYGKLGGRELSYGSDLDLVFLYQDGAGPSDGPRPVEAPVLFTRLAQRLLHLLTARTGAGTLYEVDLRLRPSGEAGLLVGPFAAFRAYQAGQAWTWEHQALVRARPVAGDRALGGAFAALRREVLARPRDPARLREEVAAMRRRMRRAHRPPPGGSVPGLDLKHAPGGIVDLEFVVQYGVLAWAHRHPALLEPTGVLGLLDAFARAGLLEREEAEGLAEAYRALRALSHRLLLQTGRAVAPPGALEAERARVRALWRRWLEAGPGERPGRGAAGEERA